MIISRIHINTFFAFCALLCVQTVFATNIREFNPNMFGLKETTSPIEKYYIIAKTHREALRHGGCVNYDGIDTINLEIPFDAEPIPLTEYTNFDGVVLKVKNNTKDLVLFKLSGIIEKDDSLSWDIIERNEFHKDGKSYLIVISDNEPWVINRKGFDFGHIRKDILFVDNGKCVNSVVAPYNTEQSSPVFYKSVVTKKEKVIENLVLCRDSLSTYKTFLFKVTYQNNIRLENIHIKTPNNSLFRDVAIQIENCTNVNILNSKIEGTYSQKDKWGYGINMNNVWNVYIYKLTAYGNWGVFGDDNVNTAILNECNINRFDIHCYGKDIKFKKCTFNNLYNQFSSIYGVVSFDKCKFNNFVPVLIEPSYNAYTQFAIDCNNCVFNVTGSTNYFVKILGFEKNANKRKELFQKNLPNIRMCNCRIVLPQNVSNYYLFRIGKHDYKGAIGGLSNITINNIEMNKTCDIDISNRPFVTTDSLRVNFKNIYYKTEKGKKRIRLKSVTKGALTSVLYDGATVESKFYLPGDIATNNIMESLVVGAITCVIMAFLVYQKINSNI